MTPDDSLPERQHRLRFAEIASRLGLSLREAEEFRTRWPGSPTSDQGPDVEVDHGKLIAGDAHEVERLVEAALLSVQNWAGDWVVPIGWMTAKPRCANGCCNYEPWPETVRRLLAERSYDHLVVTGVA